MHLLLAEDIPGNGVVQVGRPVPLDGARDVSLCVGFEVDVHLDEAQVVVAEVLGHPLRLNDGLWMRNCGHVRVSSSGLSPAGYFQHLALVVVDPSVIPPGS